MNSFFIDILIISKTYTSISVLGIKKFSLYFNYIVLVSISNTVSINKMGA